MNQITDLAPLAMLTNLEHLDLPVQTPGIADITALQALTALRVLNLSSNQNIADLTPLAGLIALENLNLDNNSIEDIAALVSNSGMGTDDEIRLQYNPLSQAARCDQIADIERRGASVLPASADVCTYILEIATVGDGDVSVNGNLYTAPMEFLTGTPITLSASPDEGYDFEAWTGDYTHTDNPATFTLTQNMAITATFSQSGAYVPGCTMPLTITLEGDASITAMALVINLPPDWTFEGGLGVTPDGEGEGEGEGEGQDPCTVCEAAQPADTLPTATVAPAIGTQGRLEFAWSSVPDFSTGSLTATIRLSVPAAQSGDKALSYQALYRTSGGPLSTLLRTRTLEEGTATCGSEIAITLSNETATEGGGMVLGGDGELLIMGGDASEGEGEGEGEDCTVGPIHSADQDASNTINLTELLRVIQFFNSGGYHCAATPDATEDGYLPGYGGDHTCCLHNSDYLNGNNWQIELTELLRITQFFNSGGYYWGACEDTEDDYLPGLEPVLVSSVTRMDPTPFTTNYIRFAVSFNNAVTGVDATDFQFVAEPCAQSDAYVSFVTDIDGANYEVLVNAGTMLSVQLDVVNDGSIQDSAGNELHQGYTCGEAYARATGPAIVLFGEELVVLECADGDYIDEGACAYDGVDGALSYHVTRFDGVPQTESPRVYRLQYSATNSRGASVAASRTVVECNGPIVFSDPLLETALTEALQTTAPITAGAAASETRVSIVDWGITDLTGMEFFASLQVLNLDRNGLTSCDLVHISGLTSLEELTIQGNIDEIRNRDGDVVNENHINKVSDLAHLAGLVNLKRLDLRGSNDRAENSVTPKAHGNDITDISPLQNLTKLQNLNLFGNRITDISPLSSMGSLVVLNLGNNYIGEIANGLSTCNWAQKPDLRRLSLQFNCLADANVSDLSFLPASIEKLDLHGNIIESIAPITALPGLIELNVFQNAITALPSLNGLTALRFLYIGNNTIGDLAPVIQLANRANPPATLERVNFLDNVSTDSNLEGDVVALRNAYVAVMTRDDYMPDCAEATENHYRMVLEDTPTGIELQRIVEVPGRVTPPQDGFGDDGRIELVDDISTVTTVPLYAPSEQFVDYTDPVTGDLTGYVEEVDNQTFHVDAPKTGALTAIYYQREKDDEKRAVGFHVRSAEAPAQWRPGEPIPIGCKRVWPPAGVDACGNFSLVCMGDGFTAYELGDFGYGFQPSGATDPNNLIPWSEAIADAWNYVLNLEPFREYQDYLAIYRVDIISEETGVTSISVDGGMHFRDTAFGMENTRKSADRGTGGRTLEGWRAKVARDVSKRIVPHRDRIVMMANGGVHGVAAGNLANTKNTVPGRRTTTAHELGHLFGPLGDEYGSGNNDPAPKNRHRPNTVLMRFAPDDPSQGGAVPPLNPPNNEQTRMHIEWNHWIEHPLQLCPGVQVDGAGYQTGYAQYCPPPNDGEICSTPLPTTAVRPFSIDSPVGLYKGGSYRSYGFRAQPLCIMNTSTGYYCKVCREQLIIDINHVARPLIKAEMTESGSVITFEATVREPQTHDLDVEWTLNGNLASTQRTYVVDKTSLNPGDYNVALTVRDAALPDGESESWVKEEYEYRFRQYDFSYGKTMEDGPKASFSFTVD